MSATLSESLNASDPRDAILFGQTPLVPMPRFGALPTLEVGRRRYIVAADGLYLQARSRVLSVTCRLAEAVTPFGDLQPRIELVGGLIPQALFAQIAQHALKHSPNEWACLIHWNPTTRGYELSIPEVVDSGHGHITYRTDMIDQDFLVLDVHTHGRYPAFFSAVDDRSDERHGCYFASVLGRCDSQFTLEATSRLVIDGAFIELPWHPWEDA